MASTQHRCVFVGNIPYDATEEQLIQICEEVGPVVSFRLVIDRETGKPKGYGFCEYKDEETALSARRNLQGYEINGRQLRVDFAENDKGADRNREQGRGGPGMAANVAEPQKQVGGPAILGEAALHQPIGLPLAMTASSVMAGALGGAQTASKSNQNGFQIQPMLGSDPLTLHLAKMSRNQLNEVISDLKAMATQNKELARRLLLASPQLPKALFQAQIMLGMVTPQVLQMPNIRQASVPLPQPGLPDGQQGKQLAAQTLSGLPPLAQNKMQVGLLPKVQEGQVQVSAVPQNSLVHNQFSALPQQSAQSQIQLPPQPSNQALQQVKFPGQSGVTTIPSVRSQSAANLPVRPQMQGASSSSVKQQMQPPLLQHPGQFGSASLGHNTQLAIPNTAIRPSVVTRPSFSDPGFQAGSSTLSSISETMNNNADRSAQMTNNTYSNMSSVKTSMVRDTSESMNHPSKLLKLDDGRKASFSNVGSNLSVTPASGPSQVLGIGSLSANQIAKAEVQHVEKKVPQLQLPPEIESALLQQVLNLTPEQLSSLPPEQQQEVIQLQQMLR